MNCNRFLIAWFLLGILMWAKADFIVSPTGTILTTLALTLAFLFDLAEYSLHSDSAKASMAAKKKDDK